MRNTYQARKELFATCTSLIKHDLNSRLKGDKSRFPPVSVMYQYHPIAFHFPPSQLPCRHKSSSFHNFAVPSPPPPALRLRPIPPSPSKYSLTFPLATSTTPASSTVAGTFTAFSNSPCTPFSNNSLNTRLSVFPLRVLGIIPPSPRPLCIIPPKAAIAPI